MNSKRIYHIALDARPLSTRVSGVGRLIAETIRHFPEREKYHFHLFSHLPIHDSHKSLLDLPNVIVHIGKGFFAKKGGLYFLFTIPAEIRKGNFDLFWGSQQVAPLFLPNDLPVVLTYCDLVLYLYPGTMRKIAALQQRFFQSHSVKIAKHIISISESTRVDQIKHFSFPESKTSVAYPGIDLQEVQNLLKQKPSEQIQSLPEKFLLSVSTIEPRKNYPLLLKSFQIYRKKAGNHKLPWVIIGKKGWESKEFYDSLESDIQKEKDIIILDNINDVDLHHAYSKCSLFLFGSFYEGFGIPLLEALAHNKKCITSDIPTFREIGGDQISYLPVDNPEIWAEKIIQSLSSDKIPKIDLNTFSWEVSANNTKLIFDKYLKK